MGPDSGGRANVRAKVLLSAGPRGVARTTRGASPAPTAGRSSTTGP